MSRSLGYSPGGVLEDHALICMRRSASPLNYTCTLTILLHVGTISRSLESCNHLEDDRARGSDKRLVWRTHGVKGCIKWEKTSVATAVFTWTGNGRNQAERMHTERNGTAVPKTDRLLKNGNGSPFFLPLFCRFRKTP